MMTAHIPADDPKLKETLRNILGREGYLVEDDSAHAGQVRIVKKPSLPPSASLRDSIRELENILYSERKGVLYKSILEILEKPIIESVLERTEGNQLKAAKILGLNRNTIRAKIKKFGINPDSFKQ